MATFSPLELTPKPPPSNDGSSVSSRDSVDGSPLHPASTRPATPVEARDVATMLSRVTGLSKRAFHAEKEAEKVDVSSYPSTPMTAKKVKALDKADRLSRARLELAKTDVSVEERRPLMKASDIEKPEPRRSTRTRKAPKPHHEAVTPSRLTGAIGTQTPTPKAERLRAAREDPAHRRGQPTHTDFRPESRTQVGQEVTYGYAKARLRGEFTVTLDTDGRVTRVKGEHLQLKSRSGVDGRGKTETLAGAEGHSSTETTHVVADIHMGSGYKESHNTLLASKRYNHLEMRAMEVNASSAFNDGVRYLDRPGAQFTETVEIQYEGLLDNADEIYEAIKRDLMDGTLKEPDLTHLSLSGPRKGDKRIKLTSVDATYLHKALIRIGSIGKDGTFIKAPSADELRAAFAAKAPSAGLNAISDKNIQEIIDFVSRFEENVSPESFRRELEEFSVREGADKRVARMKYTFKPEIDAADRQHPVREYTLPKDMYLGVPDRFLRNHKHFKHSEVRMESLQRREYKE